jgi:vacuolar-type H+-ATPase subunit H
MSLNDIVHDVEVKFEQLWDRLVLHVKDDAVADAQKLVGDAKSQVSDILTTAGADARSDVTEATADASQLAGEAANAAQDTETTSAPPTEPAAQ